MRNSNAIFGSIINAVRSDNRSNILSTPSIMTLDNQEAYILVGQEIPITTGEALCPNFDNTFRTVQRQNVGITLEVTPQINSGGSIKLDLRVEVSSIAGPIGNNAQDLILNKREIQNTITVDDGEIVGIGGLLDDNDRRTLQRIPLLGDLPIVGNLFRSRGRARGRTNLMVFVRPTILARAEDARAMSARRYDYVRGQQLLVNPNREPSLDELVRDYLGTVPPTVPQGVQPSDQVVIPAAAPAAETRAPAAGGGAGVPAAMKIARGDEPATGRSAGARRSRPNSLCLRPPPRPAADRRGGREARRRDARGRRSQGADRAAPLPRPAVRRAPGGRAGLRPSALRSSIPPAPRRRPITAGSLGFGDDLGHLASGLAERRGSARHLRRRARHPPDQRHHRRCGAAGRLRHPYRAL